MKKVLLSCAIVWCVTFVGTVRAQTPAAEPAAAPAAQAAPPAPAAPPAGVVSITDTDVKNIPVPKPEEKAAGDPAGTITGTAADIPVSDAKKGLTMADVANGVGQNMIAANFIWTLVTGFLVMFMQAGFALV